VYVHKPWWEHSNRSVPIGEDGQALALDHTCDFGKRCAWPG
jgi:hypothetical protein